MADALAAAAPRLEALTWRTDVTLSSSEAARVLRPTVLMRLALSDGTHHTVEVSVEKFHELRHATAAALHAMNIAEPRVAAARDVRARQQQRAERERTASLANS